MLLEVQGQKVAGYTQGDVTAWINHCSRNSNPVVLRTAPQGRGHLGTGTDTTALYCTVLHCTALYCTVHNDIMSYCKPRS